MAYVDEKLTLMNFDDPVSENTNTTFNDHKAINKNISKSIPTKYFDSLIYVRDLQGIGVTSELCLSAFITYV